VVKTDAAHLLRMARSVFLSNARTRLPFKGVAALYRALQQGTTAEPGANPLFYVSSSPWNLYDLLIEFFTLHNIPQGPIFLRDWGVSKHELLPTQHRGHKLVAIEQLLERYPDLPFILIGDSGQEDPEIYHEVVRRYPGRICAVYIRNVSREPSRATAIRALAQEVITVGSTLILADDTLAVAQHAVEQGWIRPETIPMIAAENAADSASPSPIEQVLGEAEPTPTVVIGGENSAETHAEVAGGAIEAALQSGDQSDDTPPTVIVKDEKP
jgi:phosphatidate phosphatase APP1